MFCPKCGKELPDGTQFCDSCGASMAETDHASGGAPVAQMNGADYTGEFDSADIEKNKILSLFAYLGILILIPLFAAGNSKYARFHSNQGLILLIVDIACGVVISILSTIFTLIDLRVLVVLIGIISLIVSLALFAFAILGIVNAVTGKAKELPIIGKFRLLK